MPELVTNTEVLIEVRAASLDPVDLKVPKDDDGDDDDNNDNADDDADDHGDDDDDDDAVVQVCHGFGRGLRELVNRYNPHVSGLPWVWQGPEGTGEQIQPPCQQFPCHTGQGWYW